MYQRFAPHECNGRSIWLKTRRSHIRSTQRPFICEHPATCPTLDFCFSFGHLLPSLVHGDIVRQRQFQRSRHKRSAMQEHAEQGLRAEKMSGEQRTQKPEVKRTNTAIPRTVPHQLRSRHHCVLPCFQKADRENQANWCVDPHEISVDVAFTLRHPACFVSCQTNSLDKR